MAIGGAAIIIECGLCLLTRWSLTGHDKSIFGNGREGEKLQKLMRNARDSHGVEKGF